MAHVLVLLPKLAEFALNLLKASVNGFLVLALFEEFGYVGGRGFGPGTISCTD
jgi:hypothetical protein